MLRESKGAVMNDKDDRCERIQRDNDKVGLITALIVSAVIALVLIASLKTIYDWFLQ